MKSYGTKKVYDLLHEAINIEAHGSMWHQQHMLWCHLKGLQGHKRLNRYESEQDRRHYIEMQNYCIDMFGELIEPEWDYTLTPPADLKGYLEAYLEWEDSVYTRLSQISAELEDMGFSCEAKLVRKGIPRREIEKVRRMLEKYTLSGWDMSYILIADHKLHEKMKKKEKKGY